MLTFQAYVALMLLLCGVAFSDVLLEFTEQRLYQDPVIFTRTSPYQRIVVTNADGEMRLFLNGQFQFFDGFVVAVKENSIDRKLGL